MVDSVKRQELEERLKSSEGTARVDVLMELSMLLRHDAPKESLALAEEAGALAAELNDRPRHALSLQRLGMQLEQGSDFARAIALLQQAMELFREEGQMAEVINCSNFTGKAYANLGDYGTAIEWFLNSLRIAEETSDLVAQGNANAALSATYQRMRNPEKAELYGRRSYDLAVKAGDKKVQGMALINIGNTFGMNDQWEKASELWHEALLLFEEVNFKPFVASALGNLGIACEHLDQYERAEAYTLRSMALKQEVGDIFEIARSHHNLGRLLGKMGRADEAMERFHRSLELLGTIEGKSMNYQVYRDMAQVLKDKGEYRAALETFEKFHEMEKEVFTADMNTKTESLQLRFDVEKAEKEKEIYRLKNIDLAAANAQITKQKEEIEQKNKDITDSINYAKRIQEALLPSESMLQHLFGEAFVLFRPKDIVSGDFFWAAEKDGKHLLAVADCTGHGVPGALMSVMGASFLSEIVLERDVTDPGDVLDLLRIKVISSLKRSGEDERQDGMDIVLCSYEPGTRTLHFAGANNPLWILRNGELLEFKGDKFPVGMYHGPLQQFASQQISLQEGDRLFLFTDGFADQFGGEKGKKIGYRRMREWLCAAAHLPAKAQRAAIENDFEKWKGPLEQIDDVLLVGIKL